MFGRSKEQLDQIITGQTPPLEDVTQRPQEFVQIFKADKYRYSDNPKDFNLLDPNDLDLYIQAKRALLGKHGIDSDDNAVPIVRKVSLPAKSIFNEPVVEEVISPEAYVNTVYEPEFIVSEAVEKIVEPISLQASTVPEQATQTPLNIDLSQLVEAIHSIAGLVRVQNADNIQPMSTEIAKRGPRIIRPTKIGEIIKSLPPHKRKVGYAAIVAALAVAGLTNTADGFPGSALQMFSSGKGMKAGSDAPIKFDKPILLGAAEVNVTAAVRIPVTGRTQPLFFQTPTSIADTVGVVIAPANGKNGKPLSFVNVAIDGKLIVNRDKVNTISTFKDYKALDVNCSTETIVHRYCAGAASQNMVANDKIDQNTANDINNLLTANGPNYTQYYHGTKAKLVVESLKEMSKNNCGAQITKLGDTALTALIKTQYPDKEIASLKGAYKFLSPNYDNTFSRDNAITRFSIERGDSKLGIPDSMKFTCTFTPASVTSAESKGA